MAKKQQLDELAQEATQSPEDARNTVPVPLGDDILEIKDVIDWRSSGIHAFNVGDFEVWASQCLAPASYKVWQTIDPTVGEIREFLQAYRQLKPSLGK